MIHYEFVSHSTTLGKIVRKNLSFSPKLGFFFLKIAHFEKKLLILEIRPKKESILIVITRARHSQGAE